MLCERGQCVCEGSGYRIGCGGGNLIEVVGIYRQDAQASSQRGGRIDMKVGKQRVDAGLTERAESSVGDGIVTATVDDVGRSIREACHCFACAVDWQNGSHIVSHHRNGGPEELGTDYRLSENHEGLHSGCYISVSILPAANALAISGGYYDSYHQPKTVFKESLPLREVTAQGLGGLLMEMYGRLAGCALAEAKQI